MKITLNYYYIINVKLIFVIIVFYINDEDENRTYKKCPLCREIFDENIKSSNEIIYDYNINIIIMIFRLILIIYFIIL